MSDSHLDRLLHSGLTRLPEILCSIYCKLEQPLINSHHDLIISVFNLNPLLQDQNSAFANIVAPRVPNTRTKISWSDSGAADYQELVQPHLQRIQELWLNPASMSSMSLLLQSTNDIMSSAAAITNKVIPLNNSFSVKSKKLPKPIRKSQQALVRLNRKVLNHRGSPEAYLDLKNQYLELKLSHRKLERIHSAQDSIDRDVKLHEFLTGDSSHHFTRIRQSKATKSRSTIKKLTVGDKIYGGETVCDGFFDSISKLKSLDFQSLEESPTFSKYCEDFENILDICSTSEKIPAITFQDAVRILDNLRLLQCNCQALYYRWSSRLQALLSSHQRLH